MEHRSPHLLVPMPHVPGLPLPLLCLEPKEAESAVALGIGFGAIEVEALRDRRLHLGHRARGLGVDVGADPVTAMHDEGARVHATL